MCIKRLFADCFKHLGMEVSYCNHKREEISRIKALVKRPEAAYSIGSERGYSQVSSIEIRCKDVAFVSLGDYIRISNKYYKIFEQPLKDSSNMLWKIEAIENNV